MELLVLYVLKNMLENLTEELGHDYEDLVEGLARPVEGPVHLNGIINTEQHLT
jgi:hypothetical protein